MVARRIKKLIEEQLGLGFKYYFYNPTYHDLFVDLDKHNMYCISLGDLRWFKMDNNVVIIYSILTERWLSNTNVQNWFKLLCKKTVRLNTKV